MPSTIDTKKPENLAEEEKAGGDKDHREVNVVCGKSKVVVPVLYQNGDTIKGAEDDDGETSSEGMNDRLKMVMTEFKDRLKFLRVNDQVKELQTTLRDR